MEKCTTDPNINNVPRHAHITRASGVGPGKTSLIMIKHKCYGPNEIFELGPHYSPFQLLDKAALPSQQYARLRNTTQQETLSETHYPRRTAHKLNSGAAYQAVLFTMTQKVKEKMEVRLGVNAERGFSERSSHPTYGHVMMTHMPNGSHAMSPGFVPFSPLCNANSTPPEVLGSLSTLESIRLVAQMWPVIGA